MKYPATLPNPSIRAAQALASACSVEGNVSTMRARSTAWTEWWVFVENLHYVDLEHIWPRTSIYRKVDDKKGDNS